MRRTLGIDDAQELVATSPFDYARQARLFIAPAELNPKSADFARRAAPLVEECLDRTRGRAFVLFTSYARLREVYALLTERLAFPVRLQGELPRSHLLDWFRRTPGAVLFATGTFWEGIDVVGDALSCVIIDRLAFPSPSDPLVMARVRALEARGLDGFEHYMVPAATVRLKQGFGRLIRSGSDRGLMALLDGRADIDAIRRDDSCRRCRRHCGSSTSTNWQPSFHAKRLVRKLRLRDDALAVHQRELLHAMALG